MVKKLTSVLTDDMDKCMFTGSPFVERHHIFGGCYKAKSEKYGFIAPLHPLFHPNGVSAFSDWQSVDLKLKRKCQVYYEEHYGNRDNFIEEFGRNYLEEDSTSEDNASGDDSQGWICDISFQDEI